MRQQNLQFVIVGHVDHGKSTLIGRLLYDTDSLPPDKIEEIKKTSQKLGKETEFAYLLDHLEEERQQGVTIDTTQVFFKTDKREYVIIDAPGHVEFVKNMITGASQAEAAVLIVDVAEGVKEQTKRHAYILSLLGLNQVLVVLNKMDLVKYDRNRFNAVRDEAEAFLKSINITPLRYIPICAITGENIARKGENLTWYEGATFLESMDNLANKPPARDKRLTFPIQDVYKVDNKRISVGRVEAGVLHEGDTIKVMPGGEITKVKTIEKFPTQVAEAHAGDSIGITTEDPLFLHRGNVICDPEKEVTLTDTFNASVIWLTRGEFHKNERIMLRCATQEVMCSISEISKRIDSSSLDVLEENAAALHNLEVGKVTIKTKKPIVITSFNDIQELGRFVLVRDENICAGGIII